MSNNGGGEYWLTSSARVWRQGADADDNTIHAMGNGHLVAFAQGPDIAMLYGPPYTASLILQLATRAAGGQGRLADEGRREIGTAIWHHETSLDGHRALEFTEFAAQGRPAYVRLFECHRAGLEWIIMPHADGGFQTSPLVPGAWEQRLKPAQKIHVYVSNLWACHWIIPAGSCRVEKDAQGALVVRLEPGKGSLTVVGATEYPLGVHEARWVAGRGAETLLEPTRAWWHAFTRRRTAARPQLAETLKEHPEAAETLDSVAVMIRSETAADGGSIAGWRLPMAYIRDQYGAARGMLALGMDDEAAHNLLFRLRKFEHFGTLQTAEGIGVDAVRHIHENDDVEGPSYTILQARDYLAATGDHQLVRRLWPMLQWCWQVQQKHLARGLLPFNGDETYIAGHFYPRSGLLQGSADTTLAFITAGQWLAEWAVLEGFWTAGHAARQLEAVAQARTAYRAHFVAGDRIWANAPEREQWIEPPEFRHGVCEGKCGWLGWTARTPNGRYLCADCLRGKGDLPAEHPERLTISSVSLLPVYLGSDIVAPAEIGAMVGRLLNEARPNGHIATSSLREGCVGYDPGLILLNLLAIGDDKHGAAAYARLMRMADQAGYWNEYYGPDDRAIPQCIRANMWASGINAEAVVKFLMRRPPKRG